MHIYMIATAIYLKLLAMRPSHTLALNANNMTNKLSNIYSFIIASVFIIANLERNILSKILVNIGVVEI